MSLRIAESPSVGAERKALIWAVEDSPDVIQTFDILLRPRYELVVFQTLAAFHAARLAKGAATPAMMIADLLLPDGCFLDVLASDLWRDKPVSPLLVASGVTDIEPMRQCLDHGAVDYIVKPFFPAELLVKVERALIRWQPAPPTGEVTIDNLSRCVSHAGKTSEPLTSREMQIMALMRESCEAPIKRDDIIKRVWGATKVTNKCLDVHLSHLRSKVCEIDLEVVSRISCPEVSVHDDVIVGRCFDHDTGAPLAA